MRRTGSSAEELPRIDTEQANACAWGEKGGSVGSRSTNQMKVQRSAKYV